MTERDQRMLTVIMEQSQRLQQQIDTFLDLSQIEAGHIRLNLKLLELCPFIERVVSEIQPTLERHQLTYSCEPTSLAIKGDELRLEQVLQNLLQNAIKYSPDGGSITVHAMQRGAEVVIEVTDQGIGIPSEAQTRLFERFYRAGNAANLGIRGLGIGLAVVTDIVSQHGGRVGVTSVEGKGSTFTVCLPAYHDAHDDDPTSMSG
jgi:signal transduction histidine kinase